MIFSPDFSETEWTCSGFLETSKHSRGLVECSFDNPDGKFLLTVQKIDEILIFFQKNAAKCFSGYVRCSFDNSAVKTFLQSPGNFTLNFRTSGEKTKLSVEYLFPKFIVNRRVAVLKKTAELLFFEFQNFVAVR